MKSPTFAPAYVGLYPILAEIANQHGYALAVHGSLNRDCDLLAAPWVESASIAEELMQAIAKAVNTSMGVTNSRGTPLATPEQRPHGRQSWAIPLGCGAVIDLSVMPRFHYEVPNLTEKPTTTKPKTTHTNESKCGYCNQQGHNKRTWSRCPQM